MCRSSRVIALVMLTQCVAQGAAAEVRLESNVVYGMVSGTALLLEIYHPQTSNGRGIVWVNGNAWATDPDYGGGGLKDGRLTRAWAIPLAEQGYTVFCINVRGTPSFRFPEPLEDVRRAIRFIRHGARAYGIDSERLGGFGASSGAHLLALAAFMPEEPSKQTGDPIEREGTRLHALILRTAPADLTNRRAAESGPVAALLGMLPPAETAPRTSAAWRTYAAASPITYASKEAPPTLLIHGDADQVVSIEQSKVLEATLSQRQVPVR